MYGGLGNQMFQYAFRKKLEKLYGEVLTDISWFEEYGGGHALFMLPEVFPNTEFRFADSPEIKQKIKDLKDWQAGRTFSQKVLNKLIPQTRRAVYERHYFTFQQRNLMIGKDAVISGYWQTEKYWQDVKQEILSGFSFRTIESPEISAFLSLAEGNNSVSLHVRRGDYLNNPEIYGGICTEEYYGRAVARIREKTDDPLFIVFSDDTEWAKEKFGNDTSFVFAQDLLPKDHPDWVEMMLMSRCRHNITANSSFSWWGAYLNGNEEKNVIAPKKWVNNVTAPDICPDDWIRI